MNVSLQSIATMVDGRVIGDQNLLIASLAPIDHIIPDSLVFAEGADNVKKALASSATAILVDHSILEADKPLIQVSNPFKAFIKLLNHFYPQRPSKPGIHPQAVIADDVILGKNVSIGPYVVIESGSEIGDDCVIKSHVSIGHDVKIGAHSTLYPQVTVYNGCQIGQRVCIHASSVIGADGFGYLFEGNKHIKIPHVGHVIIEDDVEIGAQHRD